MKRIFADFDDEGIYVYQAFKPTIVKAAVEKGTFGKGFGLDRITWIKPSLGWILHRSGYATKHRMEAIAKIKLTHAAWLEILSNTASTQFEPLSYSSEGEWKNILEKSDVIHQWDPDRALDGMKLERRAIQIGLRGEAIKKYVNEWILCVEDITGVVRAISDAVKSTGNIDKLVSVMKEYPISEELQRKIGYE